MIAVANVWKEGILEVWDFFSFASCCALLGGLSDEKFPPKAPVIPLGWTFLHPFRFHERHFHAAVMMR